MKRLLCAVTLVVGLTACQGYNPMEDFDLKEPTTLHDVPTIKSNYAEADVQRGKYLAELLACGTCHTDGALIGAPDARLQFAGSSIGIAYSNPFVDKHPGVLYPANITPDPKTGIGTWTDDELISLLRNGIDNDGKRHIPVMPWPAYAKIHDDDAIAIVAFLRSVEPIQHKVPAGVLRGNKATAPYVHFGVYQSKRP
jgi:hypothetical protein